MTSTIDHAHALIAVSTALPRYRQTRELRRARQVLRRAIMESMVGRPDELLDRVARDAEALATTGRIPEAAAMRGEAARLSLARFDGRPTRAVEAASDRLERILRGQPADEWQPLQAVVSDLLRRA